MGEMLVLGDSLVFGRPKYGICRDLTWPYIVSKELHFQLQVRAHGGSSIVDVAKESRFLNDYWFKGLNARRFDVAFVQVGIVDCCPRLAPKSIYRYMKRIPGFAKLERCSIAYDSIGRPWTSKERFHAALLDLVESLSCIAKATFFVQIANPVNHLVENVGDFSATVADYNEIIKEVVGSEFLVNWQVVDSGKMHILADGHHLTTLGHKKVGNSCLDKYKNWLLG